MTSSSGPSHTTSWMSAKSGDISMKNSIRSLARRLRISASGPSPGNGRGYVVSHDSVAVSCGEEASNRCRSVDPVRGSPQIAAATSTSTSRTSGCSRWKARSRSRSTSSPISRLRVRSRPRSERRASWSRLLVSTPRGSTNQSSPYSVSRVFSLAAVIRSAGPRSAGLRSVTGELPGFRSASRGPASRVGRPGRSGSDAGPHRATAAAPYRWSGRRCRSSWPDEAPDPRPRPRW